MSNSPPKSRLDKSNDSPLPSPPRRIQTQIHRRSKAKAVYPMTDEWEQSQESPPKGLKRPPKDMPTGKERITETVNEIFGSEDKNSTLPEDVKRMQSQSLGK